VSALCVSAGDAPARLLAETPLGSEPEPALPSHSPGFAKRPLVSAFAAKVGVTRADEDDEEDQPMPERGDLAEHFAFGLCEVVSASGGRLTLRDLRGKDRIREIESGRLSITGPVEHDGKRLFRLAKR
jgi:hypothetical protein